MDWLHKLISADAPANASLRSAELGFRGLFPWWVAALVLAAAAVAVLILYRSERGRIGWLRRGLMALLRVAAVGVVLLLLLRPVLVAEYQGERPRGVALLLDNSQSMKQRDQRLSVPDRWRVAIAGNLADPDLTPARIRSLTGLPVNIPKDPSRIDLARSILTHPRIQLLDKLKQHGPLGVYLFGQRLRAGDPAGVATTARSGTYPPGLEILAAFNADESRTALADSLHELLLGKYGDVPSAIVVMTDGRDNASKLPLDEVARECGRLKVPLHIYGVGSSEGGMLQVHDVGVTDTLFYDDTVSVPVRWRLQGYKQDAVELTLTLGGNVVARRPATKEERREQRAVLTFIPRKGQQADANQNLVASVRLQDNAAVHDELKRPVRLLDRRVKVLYVEDAPRWEYKFLQAALLRDRRVEASFLLVNGDPGVLQSGPPFVPALPARDQLFRYDLIILGDVAASYFGPERLEWLRDYVNEGGGLVMIADRRHAPAGYADTPLAEVLPVEFVPVKSEGGGDERPQPFVPVLTDVGKRTDVMALADTEDLSLRTWRELPGWYWNYPVTKLRPGAVSLLDHPRLTMGDKPMTVMATHYYGKGQVLFLASGETWRWRYNAGDRYFGRFWGQVVYQLGLPHLLGGAKRVQLALEHADALLGRPGSVYARLFDAAYRPLREERVTARLEFLDGKAGQTPSRPVMLEAVPGRPGEYRALLANDVPGRFELKLDTPEPASLPYRVSLPPQHELEPGGMAEDALRAAATLSGGRFYREEDLHRLPEQVTPQKAAFTRRQEVLLWNPLVLVLFVGLVTTEWVIRKFSNLS
jgi:hypothetical protein